MDPSRKTAGRGGRMQSSGRRRPEESGAAASPVSCRADVFSVNCPSRAVLELVAGKWPLLIIDALSAGPHRTAELRRRIGGISEKMLIQTLRRLERSGFVGRTAHPEVPPRVEYRLTRLGASLSKTVHAFDQWVERNLSEVLAAEQAYELLRRPAAAPRHRPR